MNGRYISGTIFALGIAIFPLFSFANTFAVHTSNATNVTSTSAVLEAYATGFDGDATISFDWGLDDLDNTTPRKTTSVIGEKIRIRVSGLSPRTHYTFRAHGTANGTDDEGITLSFTTPGEQSHITEVEDLYTNSTHKNTSDAPVQLPRVMTLAPSAIYGNSATLQGYADTYSDHNTRYWFQYGIRGSELAPSRASVLQYASQSFSSDVWRLSPNTEYEVRAVAENALGISVGEIVRFRTVGTGVLRIEPSTYQSIAIENGVFDASDPGHPIVHAMVWTAGAPVRVRVEYGSTRAVTSETDFVYVPQTGGVSIVLPTLTAGRTYYYRLYAEDGNEYVRGNLTTVQIPRAGTVPASQTARAGASRATISASSFWQRFITSVSGKKSTSLGIARDITREDVLALAMHVEQNTTAITDSTLVPAVRDILTFQFTLRDTSQESVGTVRFALPSGCTYLSSDGVAYDHATHVVDGTYTFQSGSPLRIRCIVDAVEATPQVLGTFTTDTITVTSNEIAMGKSGFSFSAFALGAFSLGTSTLVLLLCATVVLAFVIIYLHDRTFGGKEA